MGPRSIDQACEDLKRWKRNGCVGNVTVYAAPNSDNVDMVGDETIKLFEMDEEHKRVVRRFFDLFDSESITVFGSGGHADRVKVTRRY